MDAIDAPDWDILDDGSRNDGDDQQSKGHENNDNEGKRRWDAHSGLLRIIGLIGLEGRRVFRSIIADDTKQG